MKKIIIINYIVLLISVVIITYFDYVKYSNLVNGFVNTVIYEIKKDYPDYDESKIVKLINLSEYEDTLLNNYGFSKSDISVLYSFKNSFIHSLYLNSIFIIVISLIFFIVILFNRKKEKKELNEIVEYIKDINKGNYDLKLTNNKESMYSILKNEIYTTTVMLKEKAENELKEKLSVKDSLTNISHQLKTPLTSISLLVDNLCDNNVSPEIQKEFLEDIKFQVKNINYLIIQLLKLSKFDANVVVFKKENINVKNIIFEVLKYVDPLIDLKNINIHVNGKNNVSFIGDYQWEFEALSNIIKNCIDYIPDNKNIYIEFKENNFYTQIDIIDEGLGIAPSEVNHIFERFYKGKNSSNNNFGIGLALAKEIILKDNGKIIVSSKLDKGTKFKIKYYK